VLGAEVSPSARRSLLVDFITVYGLGGKAIVFTETKREADEVAAALASTHPCEARARPPPAPPAPAGGGRAAVHWSSCNDVARRGGECTQGGRASAAVSPRALFCLCEGDAPPTSATLTGSLR